MDGPIVCKKYPIRRANGFLCAWLRQYPIDTSAVEVHGIRQKGQARTNGRNTDCNFELPGHRFLDSFDSFGD
jgi:hypothetical protein